MTEYDYEYVNCNLCGADDTQIIYEWGKSNVVKCNKCGLIYKNPRFPEKMVMLRYAVDDYSSGVFPDPKKQIYNREINKIESIVKKGKILDVGCGYGEFLKIASKMGWTAQGVEVSSKCCKFASENYGLNVFRGTLRQAKFPEGYFDVVTMWDSLDFMYNPLSELLEVYRVLKLQGMILVRVRNAKFHIPVKHIFRNSRAVVHNYSFSPETVRLMLEKTGFKEIRVMNSSITENIPFSRFLNLLVSFLNHASNACVILPSLLAYARK